MDAAMLGKHRKQRQVRKALLETNPLEKKPKRKKSRARSPALKIVSTLFPRKDWI
jgi:hypothetical protein